MRDKTKPPTRIAAFQKFGDVPSLNEKFIAIANHLARISVECPGWEDGMDAEIWNFVDTEDASLAIDHLDEIIRLASEARSRITKKFICGDIEALPIH